MFVNTQIHRHQDGAIHCLCAKFRADQQKAQDQQHHIEDQCDDRHGKRDEIADNHSKCRSAADGHMAGQHKEIHRGRHDQCTECDNDKLFDIAFIQHK